MSYATVAQKSPTCPSIYIRGAHDVLSSSGRSRASGQAFSSTLNLACFIATCNALPVELHPPVLDIQRCSSCATLTVPLVHPNQEQVPEVYTGLVPRL